MGGGPAGIQWGLLLNSTELEYEVWEQGVAPGSFFERFPRSRRLISHNRCNLLPSVSAEFAMRHDWHSLLHAPMTYCETRDSDFYPHALRFRRYLQHAASTLRVRTRTTAVDVSYGSDGVTVHTPDGACVRAAHLVVATGLNPRPKPESAHFTYADFPPLNSSTMSAPFCHRKRVRIVGGGNAAFETAEMMRTCGHSVHVLPSRPPTFAATAHYPGGVRMQYAAIFDRYILKSMDSMEVQYDNRNPLAVDAAMQASVVAAHGQAADAATPRERALRRSEDAWAGSDDSVTIFCGGFHGAHADPTLVRHMDPATHDRYPIVEPFYGVPSSHGRGWYAGALMHGHDYRQSAGGFVHGFRYLVRAQFRI